MATTIVTKNSSTASAVPLAANLVQGELAVNVTDKRLFTEDAGGTVVELGINPSSITVTSTATLNGNTVIGNADTDTITQTASYVAGTQLKSAKTATNTLNLAAYDTDGAAYTNLVTLTASATPTLALTSTGVGTINNMSIGVTTASTGAFTTLSATGVATMSAGSVSAPAITTSGDTNTGIYFPAADTVALATGGTERHRVDSSGNFMTVKTSSATSSVGFEARATGVLTNTVSGITGVFINRLVNDGSLIDFQQDNTAEGSISVSGTTVSYNGGHLSRYAQTIAAKDESLVKGTVLSNLEEMNIYTNAEGNPVANEQLNKVKVSDVEGDSNVAGVFVNWSYDEQHNIDEINMAMTGDMIIRIAQGTIVARGDLLMSAGDGTAKPQGDDIVRAKTVAKVTSTHVTCAYEDGSYCVPCVLMAC